ncbi:MAG: carboxypeptidase M32 [Bacteroidota bacterium]
MPATTDQLYTEYKDIMQKAADINNASAVLGWDQEVYMPPKGAEFRGRQLATLASLAHEMLTSEQFGNLLAELSQRNDLGNSESVNVTRSREDFERNKKLSSSFVEELSKQSSECFNAWVESRRQNDFKIFQPSLDKMIKLKRQQAELYGYEAHPYDALIDEYEKGATVAMLDPIFNGIKENLPPILAKIKAAPQVNDDFFYRHYPRQQQWDFSVDVLKAMGYDFEAGRQDISEHPFSTSFAPTDSRITTRVSEDNYTSLLWSTIHEGGHALYEQGLPVEQYGLPLGAAASLSIHESQSRFWENCIGRGLDMWQHFYPKLQQYFPEQLGSVSLTDFYKAVNKVEPSLIRTEADEVTYHFHVLIRYEIEKAIIKGEIATADLPQAWNELYYKYLGIKAKDYKTGVIQDVHWSHGSFGYFPTYTLGSFYAAQFFAQAQKELPAMAEQVRTANMAPLLQWLRTKVHQYGRRYYSDDLCRHVTGEGLNVKYFIDYIQHKYAGVYDMK